MSDADGVTLLFLMNDNYAAGQGRNFNTSFAHTAGGSDSYLYNYSTFGGGFYAYASNIVNGSTIVPPGGYFAFSWRNPEQSNLWSLGGGKPITILQDGVAPSTLTYLRVDGPDGDPNFNPYGVPGAVPGSYSYPFTVPRITTGTDLTFTARTDGSAENVLFALDGGIDLNGIAPADNADPGVPETTTGDRPTAAAPIIISRRVAIILCIAPSHADYDNWRSAGAELCSIRPMARDYLSEREEREQMMSRDFGLNNKL